MNCEDRVNAARPERKYLAWVMTVALNLQKRESGGGETDRREGPDSINWLCEEVRRGGGVRVMKMNHYPLEN